MLARIMIATALLATTTSAYAAPPIGYIVSGSKNSEVWLMQPDGSGKVRIYTGPRDTTLSYMDMRPGGGQVAFLEAKNYPKKIMVVSYDDAGVVTGTQPVPQAAGCSAEGFDYHPTDQSILFTESCNSGATKNINRWTGSSVDPVFPNLGGTASLVRWLRDGSGFIWKIGSTELRQQIRKSSIDNPQAYTVLWQLDYSPNIMWMDMARTTDALLMSYSGPPAEVRRVEFDFAGVTDKGVIAVGQQGHYSPDDSALLYRFQTKRGYQAIVKDSAGTRTIATGGINSLDWGN